MWQRQAAAAQPWGESAARGGPAGKGTIGRAGRQVRAGSARRDSRQVREPATRGTAAGRCAMPQRQAGAACRNTGSSGGPARGARRPTGKGTSGRCGHLRKSAACRRADARYDGRQASAGPAGKRASSTWREAGRCAGQQHAVRQRVGARCGSDTRGGVTARGCASRRGAAADRQRHKWAVCGGRQASAGRQVHEPAAHGKRQAGARASSTWQEAGRCTSQQHMARGRQVHEPAAHGERQAGARASSTWREAGRCTGQQHAVRQRMGARCGSDTRGGALTCGCERRSDTQLRELAACGSAGASVGAAWWARLWARCGGRIRGRGVAVWEVGCLWR